MSIFRQLFGVAKNAGLKDIIEQGAFLVDVRTPAEFSRNHVKGLWFPWKNRLCNL